MPASMHSEVELQRRYYAETATRYDGMHVHEHDEHQFALCLMLGIVDYFGIRSVLDVGSGTGRVVSQIKRLRPDLVIRGVEPVRELREAGHRNGIPADELVEGDATALQFDDGSFDLVCEFGVLHHIKTPSRAVSEMLRVAQKGIFISDSNNFGQGGAGARLFKQAANAIGLWPLVDFVKTRGRGYTISEGDGLGYSYSVFNDYALIRKGCASVHLLNTTAAGSDLYRSASHVALLGIK